jgi:hypothetical protein
MSVVLRLWNNIRDLSFLLLFSSLMHIAVGMYFRHTVNRISNGVLIYFTQCTKTFFIYKSSNVSRNTSECNWNCTHKKTRKCSTALCADSCTDFPLTGALVVESSDRSLFATVSEVWLSPSQSSLCGHPLYRILSKSNEKCSRKYFFRLLAKA